MKKNKEKKGSRVLEAMQIPPDLARKDCIATLCGNSGLYIENYRRILEYREESIRILTYGGRLKIRGENLEITSYTCDEMYVAGQIAGIEICPEQT